jgi:hypothetical protein
MQAVSGVYERLILLKKEIRHIDLLLRLADEEGAAKVYRNVADPSELRRTRDVPAVTALVRQHQSRRLSLPRLPEFPSEEELHLVQRSQTAILTGWTDQASGLPPEPSKTSLALHEASQDSGETGEDEGSK